MPAEESHKTLLNMLAKRKAFAASTEKPKQPRFVKPNTSSAKSVKFADRPEETPDTLSVDANGEF